MAFACQAWRICHVILLHCHSNFTEAFSLLGSGVLPWIVHDMQGDCSGQQPLTGQDGSILRMTVLILPMLTLDAVQESAQIIELWRDALPAARSV